MSAAGPSNNGKRVRLCRVAENDRRHRHDVEKTYPVRAEWKAKCIKDVWTWSMNPAVVHERDCQPELIGLTDTLIGGGDVESIRAIFVYECPCGRAKVIVSQLD